MSEEQLAAEIKETETFKSFPGFKKPIVLKRKNVQHLQDLYGQASRLGMDYLKQNVNIMQSDIKLIEELINKNK